MVNTSVEYLDSLKDQCGEDWKKKLSNYLQEDKGTLSAAEELCITDFLNAYKEDIIEKRTNSLKKAEKIIDNDLLMNDLKRNVERTLEAYYAIEPLRLLEIQDYESAVKAVDCIFEQAVLRFHPDIDKQYKKFGFLSREQFVNVIGVIVSLVEFAVSGSLYPDAAYAAIYQNSRLSKKMCHYIADKIENHYEKIQMKLLIEKLYQDS